MHPADIRAAVVKAQSSQAAIAKSMGVSPGAVSNVIHQKSRSDAIASRIAEVVSIPRCLLWPGVYGHEAPPPPPAQARPHLRLRLSGAIELLSWRRAP